MPLVIYGLGGAHTHTYFGRMKVITRNQAPGLKSKEMSQTTQLAIHELIRAIYKFIPSFGLIFS